MQSSIERTVSGVRCTNDDLKPVLVALATDQPLDVRYRDHDLSGDWAGYRECHIKPDLLLIYRKSDADTLRLARLGGTVAKLAMRQPFVLFKGLTFQKLCLP
ncbi:type II toxin-antitoxin system YafQ family toxin, partial [Raoultella ornithinolytica]